MIDRTQHGRSLAYGSVFVGVVVAAVGSLGAPLITSVATSFDVPLSSAQWTLTLTLLIGAVATPILGRLGSGPHRRGAILAALTVVAAGGIVTTLPLSFAWLLVGRGAQGVGLALTSMLMGVARGHLPEARANSTIASLSVASTVGVGIGYPLSGLLADVGGIRMAYGIGAALTILALVVAWMIVPVASHDRSGSLDVPGALLLATFLSVLLLLVSDTSLWTTHPAAAAVLAVVAGVAAAAWIVVQLASASPLVDLRLFRHGAVVGANAAMFLGGIGMYLLLTLITRYAQTPAGAGYGFGLSAFGAGSVLIPFSLFGFFAGRIAPRAARRMRPAHAVTASALVVLVALAVFAVDRTGVVELCVAMAVLGFGVGSFSATMPAVVLSAVPDEETSSAMSVNQVVRSVGFAVGSAVGGLVLAAGTPNTGTFPSDEAYTIAAFYGMAAVFAAAIVSASVLHGRAIAGHPT
ncbi:MFS transporter [Rhodococcus fascians]|nr:MFS transporter [Rhodococcus fascians]MBY4397690.1 MFS transporter [Rhodococcus fascians]MBY4406680.1 MFS transporter [Rhodococcus fascians]MBY4422451.1 MFS transporter [Rhodococcus fascians]MBY4461946.1 MFS transporter [Rhodococcus fascians]